MAKWPLLVADWSREYPHRDLATETVDSFRWHLQGLSEHSVFAHAVRQRPKRLYDPADIAAVTKAARA